MSTKTDQNTFVRAYKAQAKGMWWMVRRIHAPHLHGLTGLLTNLMFVGVKMTGVVAMGMACVTVFPLTAGLAWVGHKGAVAANNRWQQRRKLPPA